MGLLDQYKGKKLTGFDPYQSSNENVQMGAAIGSGLLGGASPSVTQPSLLNAYQNAELGGLIASVLPPDAIAAGALKGGAALSMYPASKARLIADLKAGKSSGSYALGDVTEGQLAGLNNSLGSSVANNEVMINDNVFNHILQRRINQQGYTPEEVGNFAELAMRPSAKVMDDHRGTSLVNPDQYDKISKRYYDPTLPIVEDNGLLAVSVIPDRLPARKSKTR